MPAPEPPRHSPRWRKRRNPWPATAAGDPWRRFARLRQSARNARSRACLQREGDLNGGATAALDLVLTLELLDERAHELEPQGVGMPQIESGGDADSVIGHPENDVALGPVQGDGDMPRPLI